MSAMYSLLSRLTKSPTTISEYVDMAQLPSPPFIPVDGIHNFRDIGGYPISTVTSRQTHRCVRRSFVFRCAATTQITDEGKRQIKELGIRAIFDLRSNSEIGQHTDAKYPFPMIDGVNVFNVPIFSEKGFGPVDLVARYQNEGLIGAYLDILELAGPAYRQIFQHIRDKPTQPFLVHCAAGKDRTGLACALILAIATCNDETIAAEYELTEQGNAELVPLLIAKLLLQYPELEEKKEVIRELCSARAENMMITLDLIRQRYGGAAGYLKDKCGFDSSDTELIYRNLVA